MLLPNNGWAALSGCTLLASFFAPAVTAPVVDQIASAYPAHTLAKRYDNRWIFQASSTSYPSDDDIRHAITLPENILDITNFVFWSELGSTVANGPNPEAPVYEFARSIDGLAIQDILPADYLCPRSSDITPDPAYTNFIDRVSGIWADLAGGTANAQIYLVTSSMDGIRRTGVDGTAEQGSTFFRVEAPTLRTWNIQQVTYVNYGDTSQQDKKDLPPLPIGDAPTTRRRKLAKRDEPHIPVTLNWEGYGASPGSNCPNANHGSYSSGWCGMHIVQWPITPNTDPLFGFNMTVFDSNQELIGGQFWHQGVNDRLDVDTVLPYTIGLITDAFDNDAPFNLQYSSWGPSSIDDACSVGAYDWTGSYTREMDCGFPCT